MLYIYHTYIHRCNTMECYLAVKKDELLPFATIVWTLKIFCYMRKVRQRKKIPYNFIYAWNISKKK